MAENDIAPLRILYYGNDIFTWYIVVSYLLLCLDNPNDSLQVEFMALCMYLIKILLLLLLLLLLALPSTLACIVSHSSADYTHHLHTITTTLQTLTTTSTSSSSLPSLPSSSPTYPSISPNTTVELVQSLRALFLASGPTLQVSINEVNLQCHSSPSSSTSGTCSPEMMMLRSLNSDAGSQLKLKVPFVSTVSALPLAVSPLAYEELCQSLSQGEAEELPTIAPHPKNPTPFTGELDYWLLDGECKQIKARDMVGGMVLHREPRYKQNAEALGLMAYLDCQRALGTKQTQGLSQRSAWAPGCPRCWVSSSCGWNSLSGER